MFRVYGLGFRDYGDQGLGITGAGVDTFPT